jgi:hypothetical protein
MPESFGAFAVNESRPRFAGSVDAGLWVWYYILTVVMEAAWSLRSL